MVDGTFLVARHRYSYESDIRAAVDALRFVKANILGVVVNDYTPDRTAKKNSHYSQYYYGSYDDGDKSPEQKKVAGK